jgi:lipoate-protein ligase A
MRLLESMELWVDGLRTGPENMAIDDWLSRVSRKPVLRIYGWRGDWMSLGYFGKAEEIFPGRAFVRRPTGGGIVDHREDWTYSLVVPRGWSLAEMPVLASYQKIHQSLQLFLQMNGVDCQLMDSLSDHQGGWCFHNPVRYDLVDRHGRKIAGAGQRRNRNALLHQGSLQGSSLENAQAAMTWAESLAQEVRPFAVATLEADWLRLHDTMYACDAWNRKR